MVISALLSEAGDDAVRAAADGRFRLPEEWRFLALAAAELSALITPPA